MKMNSHSRSFVKLVQHDLLALSDASLLYVVHHWIVSVAYSNASSDESLNSTRVALGYTYIETTPPREDMYGNELNELPALGEWRPPTPPQLRTLLTDMDVNQFLQHVLPLAFLSLHTAHPEWGEGMTFHAHLANYLRQKENIIEKR